MLTATLNITIPLDTGSLVLARGEEVDRSDIPAGSLSAMIRLGQLVDSEDFEGEPADMIPPEPETDPAILDIEIDMLGLQPQVVEALECVGILTIGDIAEHGIKHGGLTDITGVGDATEAIIQAAINKQK